MITLDNGEHCHKIDVHTHIMPENMPRWSKLFGYEGFIHLEHHKNCKAKMMVGDKFFREIDSNCWSGQDRINDCEHHNIDIQVLSTIPVLFNYWATPKDCLQTSQFLNDHIAETVQAHPNRFIGLGTLPMQDPELAIRELERCVKDLGIKGVEIGTHINDWNLDRKELFDFYKAAQDLGAAIFIHPWDMMGKDSMPKYWLPWLVGMPAETSRAICSMIFGGVFEEFKDLRVLFAHGGGSFPATIGRIEHGFNVRPDLVAIDNPNNPRNYLKSFYLDSLTHDEEMLAYLIDLLGSDKIALGSDYPFPLGELEPGKIIEQSSRLSVDDKKNMMFKTALEWLNINSEEFTTILEGGK